jgi:hypothetical protein
MQRVRECHTVAFNVHIPEQGEVDVIGIAGAGVDQHIWIAEVSIHLDGLNYGVSAAKTVEKIAKKIQIARRYASRVYGPVPTTVELWAPFASKLMVARLRQDVEDLQLVMNEEFTDRVNQLAALAAKATTLSGHEAFRFLQILTHLRGDATPRFSPVDQFGTLAN